MPTLGASLLVGLAVIAASASSASAMSLATAWGLNDEGQLGNGSTTGPEHCVFNKLEHVCSITPLLVNEAGEVTAVAAGKSHSLALLSNGTVEAWGGNSSGQLGNGTTTGSDVPVPIAGLSEVTAIAAGTAHSLALLSNGTVEAWGANEAGELGNGTTTSSDVPVAVPGLSEVVAVAAGDGFSLALLSNGTVEAWGTNEVGQLGNGTSTGPEHCLYNKIQHPCSTTPIVVTGLTGVTAISSGFAHSLALLNTGGVKAWGFNNNGQLGDGTSTGPQTCSIEEFAEPENKKNSVACSTKPVSVVGLTEAHAVAAGEAHSLAAKAGIVEAWGENEEGELGDGATSESSVPVAVSGLGEVSAVAAGGRTSMALLPDGTMRAWGANFYGQLGDGTKLERLKPVIVCGMSGVLSIATRGGHSLAATTNAPRCPAVTQISPTAGPSGGGTSVTITGTNLAEATEVHFGNTKASSFTVESPTTITAVSPPGSGTVDITVTTPLGTSQVTAADHFTYEAAPTVTKVAPSNGTTAGGTSVTLTGTGFTEATEVHFGSSPAASFKIESATTITAVSPGHEAGTVDITVTTAFGTSSTSEKDRFTFIQLEPPELGRCIKVGAGLGTYAGTNCTATGGERKYEWFPAFSGSRPLVKKHFTEAIKSLTEASLTPLAGIAVTCTGQTGEGEYVAAKAVGGVTMTFAGCHRGELGKCESSGAGEGVVKTSTLKGELGIVKASTEAVKDKLGLDLRPESGETVMEFTCAGVPVRVTGSVIVEVKANSMLSKATLKYTGTSGVQKPSKFEGGVEDVLHSTIGEGSPEHVALLLTTVLTNAERVEINSVV